MFAIFKVADSPSGRSACPDALKLATGVLLGTLTFVAGPAAWAQDGLSLRDALRESLRSNPATLLQRQQIFASRGAVMQTEGQFDPVLNATVSRSNALRPLRQDERTAISSGGIPDPIRTALGMDPVVPTSIDRQNSNLVDYSTGVLAQLRNGMTLGASVGITTSWDNLSQNSGIPPQSSGRIGFTLRAPLLRNAGRNATTANLDAAELELSAARSDLVFTNAQTLLGVALSYWEYLAAYRRLDIARDSEQRSARLVEEVQKLIAAQEMPAADAQLVQASLNERMANRIAAEQAVAEGRRNLGAQIGLAAERGYTLPAPADDFPAFDGKSILVDTPSRSVALLGQALSRRADLQAAQLRESAANRRVASARSGLKPQVDLNFSVNYGSLVESRTPFAIGPVMSTHSVGPSLSATLSAQLPWKNSAAGGVLLAQSAARDASTIRLRNLQDAIGINLQTSVQALVRSAQQLARASEATRFYHQSVESESTKRRMGMSTLIDVINMQDRLTNALLAEVQVRQSYANAIARLRFETGAIVTPVADGFEIAIDDFFLPRFDVAAP